MSASILIVDDEADIRNILCDILEDEGYDVVTAAHSEEAYKKVADHAPSIAILDIWLENSDQDGLEILQNLTRQHPEMTVLMISGHGNVETAVKAMHLGAYDFIEKPFKIEHLIRTVERAAKTSRIQNENLSLRVRLNAKTAVLNGESAAIQAVIKEIQALKGKNMRVMIDGPRGSGKSSAASLLAEGHEMISLDCTTCQKEELETRLKEKDQVIVLDHLQNLTKEAQDLLINTIKQREDIPRIIAIPDRETGEGFSSYLKDQLSVETLVLPALSQRAQDIPILAKEFIRDACIHFGVAQKTVSASLQRAVSGMKWPGNVGQLKLACQWAVEMALIEESASVEAHHLPGGQGTENEAAAISDLMAQPLREARESFERDYLNYHIRQSEGVITKMADNIGMDRAALHRKIKSLEINEAAEQAEEAIKKEA